MVKSSREWLCPSCDRVLCFGEACGSCGATAPSKADLHELQRMDAALKAQSRQLEELRAELEKHQPQPRGGVA